MPNELLNPKKSWIGQANFKDEVRKLGALFAENFKKYADEATDEVIKAGELTVLPAIYLLIDKILGPELESNSKPSALDSKADGNAELERTETDLPKVNETIINDRENKAEPESALVKEATINGGGPETKGDEDSTKDIRGLNGDSSLFETETKTNGYSTEQSTAVQGIVDESQTQPDIESKSNSHVDSKVATNGDSGGETKVDGNVGMQSQVQPDVENEVKPEADTEAIAKAKAIGDGESKIKIEV